MKQQHDFENLNDFECWHVERFRERLERCRLQNIGEATCFIVARKAAQHSYPLEPDESARVDAYIESRFGKPAAAHEPRGLPAPVMVVG